jgi:quinol monooxygenase YgiN
MTETSSGPIVRLAELEIEPSEIENYKALLAEEIEASIEPGVQMLYALSVKGSPAQILIVEVYADHDAHLRSPHFLRYKALTSGLVRSLRLVETEPIMLGAKTSARR